MVDEATALSMFPKFPIFVAGDGENAIRYEPPLITWLAGPIWCDGCGGDTSTPMYGEHDCPRCDGRGYPSSLEIVSKRMLAGQTFPTLHGIIDLGAPVPVEGLGDHHPEPSDESLMSGVAVYVFPQDDEYRWVNRFESWPNEVDITLAIAGTPTPGGVVYPVTVRS